jgi:hypothetical protein
LVEAAKKIFLWLDGPAIDDAGVAHLTGLTGLAHLDLCNTSVGDAGLARLEQLANLKKTIRVCWIRNRVEDRPWRSHAGWDHRVK